MKNDTDRLVRHLVLAVALKLGVLALLWWTFVADQRVGVDKDRAADHLGVGFAPSTLPSNPHGAPP